MQFDTTTATTADRTAVSSSSATTAGDSTGAAVWSAACAALVDTAVLDRGLKAAGMQTLLLQRRRSSLGATSASNSSGTSTSQQPPLDLWSVLFTRYAAVSITTYDTDDMQQDAYSRRATFAWHMLVASCSTVQG